MPDIYVKPFAKSDRFDVKSPLDQTEASDPKKFPYETKLQEPWGWYPFIYQSPATLLLGGLNDFAFSSQGLPNFQFTIPSIEILPGGGGLQFGGGGGAAGGGDGISDAGVAAAVCRPQVLAGGGGDQDTNFKLCQSLLDPCDLANLMFATAASELGSWNDLSNDVNARIAGGDEEAFRSSFNATIGTCPSSEITFKFFSSIRIIEIETGIFCSPACTCLSFSFGAGFQRCTRRTFADGSTDEICASVCNVQCGFSGHGCAPAGGVDWSGTFKAYTNCLKAVAKCAKPILEKETGCPNCEIDSDSLQALDTTF